MIRLKKVTLNKYKSYETEQSFEVDDKVTVLVGKNEAGKTAALEAIAKTNYFEADESFEFNPTHDYPRKEKKRYEKSGKDAQVCESEFEISDDLIAEIVSELGEGVFTAKSFTKSVRYSNGATIGGIEAYLQIFLRNKVSNFSLTDETEKENIESIESSEGLEELISAEENSIQQQQAEENQKAKAEGRTAKKFKKKPYQECLESLRDYFENEYKWGNPLSEYIYRVWIKPYTPKYLYYDEYYALPSRIDIAALENENLEQAELKTSQALFDLADINIGELISSDDFEAFVAELEATGNEITQQLFKYWSTNPDLRIRFQIDKQINKGTTEHVLDIRVENLKHMVTLPLRNRSKGFNWFFSFIVWFSKIQEDKESNYILLLDEPGLNLHASAQADLLRFIESLSEDYQIIYTTHSPFMVEPGKLHRVRTIVEKDDGTHITESIQEKDPDTLFPLQAALGYDIAQNLFISKNNLLVEGPADLLFLNVLGNLLEAEGRTGLKNDVTVVPVGGLDKVVTFISLLRATKLNIVCLLDTFSNSKGKQRVDELVKSKVIKQKNLKFFDEFTSGDKADIEDMFTREEYLKIFNATFPEYDDVKVGDLDPKSNRIIPQLNQKLKIDRFNHYRPANYLAQQAITKGYFSEETLNRFEGMFEAINKLFA